MNTAETPELFGPIVPPKPSMIQRFLRYVYAGNPFYLLSVCFVFHGTAAWFQSDAAIHNPWPLRLWKTRPSGRVFYILGKGVLGRCIFVPLSP